MRTCSHIVNAFSLDNLFLALRTSSQNLWVVKPSVARVIFLSSKTSSTLLFLMEGEYVCTFVYIRADDDIDDVNISAIHLFEHMTI
jgi:hypothetical protein